MYVDIIYDLTSWDSAPLLDCWVNCDLLQQDATLTSAADPLSFLILQASVLHCSTVVLIRRVFLHQVHHKDGLQEAQHHQGENSKTVDN